MNQNTIVRKKSSFLGKKSKDEFIEEVVKLLNGKVFKAYVFGSFFSDRFNADSDFDLLLIADTDEDFLKRPLLFSELDCLDAPIDLLVYTPKEFEKIESEEKIGFWKSIFEEMVQII